MAKKNIVCMLFIFLFFYQELSYAKILDKIVAIVNGEIITLYDLKKEIKRTSISRGVKINLNDPDILKGFLSEMINKVLLREEADRLKIKVSKYEIENSIKQLIKSSGLTEDEFKKNLEKQGLTLKDIKKSMEDDIKINRLISYMVRSKIVVTDEDVTKYIKEHNIDLSKKKKVYIVLFQSNNRDALEHIKIKGEDEFKFPKDVKMMDMGEVDLSGLQPRWKKALLGVREGEFTHVFKIGSKYVRLYVKSIKVVDPLSISHIKDKIKQKIFREKLKKRYIEYINRLKEKSVIEVRI